MKNYIIGQYGHFSNEKFKKDYRKGFYGVEACLMNSEEDICALVKAVDDNDLKLGIHFPLRGGVFKNRDPLFLDADNDVRVASFKQIEEELEYIKQKRINPEYILFHYPKPVIIPNDFDLSRWRFYDRSEYVYEAGYSFNTLIEQSENIFQWLSIKASEYNFIPVLELDTLNKYILKTTFLNELLIKYPTIKLCIDIGRIHVQSRIDAGFDDVDLLKKFARYTKILHLWHAKVGETVEHGHFPLLPDLKPEDGWADVEKYFEIIRSENRDIKLLFEHRSDLITDEELDSCYEWIDRLYNKD